MKIRPSTSSGSPPSSSVVGTSSADPASTSARCLLVRAPALKAIRSGLRANERAKLGTVRAVKAKGDFSHAPSGFSQGVYFISAKLRGKGIASWAVSTSFLRSGGGLAFAVGKVARRYSTLGVGVPVSILARWGISTGTYEYAESRACVK